MTSNEEEKRIFVISDLHATSETNDSPDTWATTGAESGKGNPFESLLDKIEEDDITADYLVFCGDLTNKHDEKGLEYSWDFLQSLGSKLGTQQLISTVGNHDINSRLQGTAPDPCDSIRALKPEFPTSDTNQRRSYWADDYYIYTDENIRFVSINSCRFHGVRPSHSDEIREPRPDESFMGRFIERSLSELINDLKKEPYYPINILISHHSPQIHSEYKLGEDDYLRNGQLVVDALGNGEFGDWMLVHGHKHHPKLSYSYGGACSPVILSSGSASVKLYHQLEAHSRNQVHLIKMPVIENKSRGKLYGTIDSLSWSYGYGWRSINSAGGLPTMTGFGIRDLHSIAVTINTNITKKTSKSWDNLVQDIPQLKYITPIDIGALSHILLGNFNIQIEFDSSGHESKYCIPLEVYAHE